MCTWFWSFSWTPGLEAYATPWMESPCQKAMDHLDEPDRGGHWTHCCQCMGCCWGSANLEGDVTHSRLCSREWVSHTCKMVGMASFHSHPPLTAAYEPASTGCPLAHQACVKSVVSACVMSFPKFHYSDTTDLLPICCGLLDLLATDLLSPILPTDRHCVHYKFLKFLILTRQDSSLCH